MIMEPLMATAAEATDMLRVGGSSVYRLIAARQRESIKIGRPQRASVASIPTSRPRVRRCVCGGRSGSEVVIVWRRSRSARMVTGETMGSDVEGGKFVQPPRLADSSDPQDGL